MALATLLKATTDYLKAEERLAQSADPLDRPQLREEFERATTKLRDVIKACDPAHARPGAIRKIAVAVDSSEPSRWALDRAISLAEDLGAKVMLVHVLELVPVLEPEFAFDDAIRHNAMLEGGRDLLHKTAAKVPAHLLGDQVLREGITEKQIVLAAQQVKADLLVLGTHGRGLLGRFLLGSTAEAVVRHASCPVLTVGHPIHGAGDPEDVRRMVAGAAAGASPASPAHAAN